MQILTKKIQMLHQFISRVGNCTLWFQKQPHSFSGSSKAKMNLACDLNVFSREGSGSVLPVLPTIFMSDKQF